MMDQILFESNECYDLRVDGLFQIGRSPLCQAILRDTHVSKMHCSLNIRSKDDSSSSDDSEFKVMITDHSSNGTWISTGGKTLKLEKEKSTLLKEGDIILLTRFTRANHEAFGYKYLSTPFPRVIKCIYKKVADKASIPKYEESNVQICDGKSMKTVERASKRDSQGRTVNQNGGKNICRTSATFVRSTGSPDAKRYNENRFNVDERNFETTSKAGKTRSGSFKSCDVGREEHVCSRARSDDKNRPTMKRKYKADKQYFRSRKLRFKSQTEERPEPRSCYHDDKPVKKREFHKEAATNQCVALAADRVPGKDSCTKFTKEKYTSANTSNEQVASNKIEGISHPSSSLLVMKESDYSNILSRSESPSKLPKSAKAEEKCTSSLTESTGKSDKLEQSCGNFDISTSMCLDRIEYGKCVHCGKFIPSVTISLHEAVCEGQSQEAKSQDHVPLSSLPLEGCLFAVSHSKSDSHITEKLTTSGDENEIEEAPDLVHGGRERKLGEDEGVAEQAEDKTAAKKNLEAHRRSLGNSDDVLGKSNERVIAVEKCKSREIEGLNLDETPDKKTLETSKSLPSASPYVLERCTTPSEDMNTAATGTCKSAKCEGKFLREPVPASTKQLELKESVTDQETGSISAHRNPTALEKEESNERCTFCSALFPLPDLILHVSTCSETSAVPCTDSSDSESEQEACPYCGKSFDVLDLVEHAEHCKTTLSTTISAREIRQNDWLPSSLMERGSLSDPVVREESPVRDKELCPKCHGEFALLELVNHADKCTGEGSSVGVGLEASRVGVNGHCFDGSHSDRGLDKTVDEGSLSDAESDSNYDTSKDEDGIRYGEVWRHSRSRSGSDSENSFSSSISGKVNERKDEGENEGSFIDAAHKGIVDVGDDTTYGGHDYSDSDGETSIHKSLTKDDDHEHVGMETSADDSDSDEFEFCPNCRKPFHLSRLIEHASNCTSVFPAVKTSSESRSCPGRSEPSDLSTLTPTVFTNCAQCGKRLTVDLLAVHYSECGKLNATEDERKSREAEESHLESILEPFDCRDNLSSRVEVESDRRENRPAISSETFTLKKAPSTTESEVSSFSDDSSKDDETTTLSFKRKLSSLDSYQEFEEQCMFCLKIFAVSALVEHVCACATNQAAKDDLEQCCYCYQTFPLSKLITHAESCVKKTAFSQENSQSCMTHSQSPSAELMERCMYCFKDFPVSKLIIHSQKCDGDMSGPRERFQGFIPSVHDLSAISSDAILTDTQRAALQYVILRSAQDSKNVFSGLLARVQRLGYSENDLTRTLQWVRSAAPIIIHINLDRVLRFLVEDTHYRNQFETGTSGGSTDLAARRSWEDRIFNNSYRHSSPSERVKYGVLNIVGDPRGVRRCSSYGDSFLQLKKVRLRTTFASMDTSGAGVKLSCCEHYENVLYSYTNGEITAIMDVATGKVPFHRSDCISNYKEVQIHGPVSLSENVECIVANARHQADPRIESLLYRFVEQNKCNLIWMDPDDMTGAAPLRLGPSLAPSFLTAEFGSISRLSRGSIDRERTISKRVKR